MSDMKTTTVYRLERDAEAIRRGDLPLDQLWEELGIEADHTQRHR